MTIAPSYQEMSVVPFTETNSGSKIIPDESAPMIALLNYASGCSVTELTFNH